MQRSPQVVLILATIVGSWLSMQAVHELGHVVAVWMTGGSVERVVLHPLAISRTDLAENPHPLLVAWAGPIIGVALPIMFWLIAARARFQAAFVARFFAGFCLLANGLYIGIGSLDGVGDAGDMLRHGSPQWQLRLFGAFTAPLGLCLWHRQGEHFGLGPANGNVNRGVALGCLIWCAAMVLLGIVVGGE